MSEVAWLDALGEWVLAWHTTQGGSRYEIGWEGPPPVVSSRTSQSRTFQPSCPQYGGGVVDVVAAFPSANGTVTSSFVDCTITSNNVVQVSTRQPIMGRYMQASGSVEVDAMVRCGVRREC